MTLVSASVWLAIEQLGDGIADGVEAQLDAGVGSVGGARCNRRQAVRQA